MKKTPKSTSPTTLTGKHSPITKRRAISAPGALVILGVVVVAVILVFDYIPPHPGQSIIPGQSTTTNTAGLSAGKIVLNFADPLAGGSDTPSTVYVIPAAGVQVGGITYSGHTSAETVAVSSGTGTTGLLYPPGAKLGIYEVLSSYQTLYWQISAPGATSSQIQGGQWPGISLFEPKLATPVITMAMQNGTALTSAKAFNFTTAGVSSETFTLTISNTLANSAWFSTQDPTQSPIQNWCAAVQFKEGSANSSLTSISGFPANGGYFTSGSTRYWQSALPDGVSLGASNIISSGSYANTGFSPNCSSYSSATGGLTTQTQGSTQLGGTVTLKFTVSKSALAHGDKVTYTVQCYKYYDPAYAAANSGNGGTNAATFGSSYTLAISA